ncbi:MAG: hydrogenase maturation nickel metallochaperone HypA/HybF [Planctomycetota bacterium]|jgi:hydrogenase nickel incorporation protein HypA/HybF
MHETAIAQGLFAVIEKEAEKQKAKPLSAKITCGLLNAVNDEVLQFAFDAICKGTICESTKLEIYHKPLQGKCKSCDEQFDIEISKPLCSRCGSGDFELLPDEPIILQEIEF